LIRERIINARWLSNSGIAGKIMSKQCNLGFHHRSSLSRHSLVHGPRQQKIAKHSQSSKMARGESRAKSINYLLRDEFTKESDHSERSFDEIAEAETIHSQTLTKESRVQIGSFFFGDIQNKTVAEIKRLSIQTHKLKACNAEDHFYIYDLLGNYLLVCRGICYDAYNSWLIRCQWANHLRRPRPQKHQS